MAHSCNCSFRNIQISIQVCLLCIGGTKFLNFFIHLVLQNVGIDIHRNTDTGMPHQFLYYFRFHFLLKTSGCESMSYRMWMEVTNDLRLSMFPNRKYSFFLPHPFYHFSHNSVGYFLRSHGPDLSAYPQVSKVHRPPSAVD